MIRKIEFEKMHGAGNDYIYVNTDRFPISNPEQLSIKLSKPHTGIGSDGLILIGKSNIADFSMRIFNADGSEALMCGNGSRCVAKYVYEHGLTTKSEITLETLSGIKILKLHFKDNKVDSVTVDMGETSFEPVNFEGKCKENMVQQTIKIDDKEFVATAISMGNPHLVIFVNDVEHFPVSVIGPKLENHPFFPNRINVEFAQILSDNKIRMRVWERGSGITMACGTGACATEVAACITGKSDTKSEIMMDGGSVIVEFDKESKHVLMTGPATKVFEGTIEIEE